MDGKLHFGIKSLEDQYKPSIFSSSDLKISEEEAALILFFLETGSYSNVFIKLIQDNFSEEEMDLIITKFAGLIEALGEESIPSLTDLEQSKLPIVHPDVGMEGDYIDE